VTTFAFLSCQITRDRWITHWLHPESGLPYKLKAAEEPASKKRKAVDSKGSKSRKSKVDVEDADDEVEEEKVVVGGIEGMNDLIEVLMGSGYPSGASL
jgi:hypothetical protein